MTSRARGTGEGEPGWQPWMPTFLVALEDTLDVTQSAKVAGVTRQAAWWSLNRCVWFKAGWDEIFQVKMLNPLRASIAKRAIHGTKKDIWRQVPVRQEDGSERMEWQVIGHEVEHETALTKMVAERRLPEYRDGLAAQFESEAAAAMARRLRTELANRDAMVPEVADAGDDDSDDDS